MPRTSPLALAFLALTITACEDSAHRCGPFVYSPEEGRCTCPPGWIENEEFTGCLSLDAGPPPDDAAMPDASTCVPEECNGEDDDCDGETDESGGTWFRDADGDGNGDPLQTSCGRNGVPEMQPDGYVADDTDCDDTRASVRPDAPERCDGLDQDCDGMIDDNDACPEHCVGGTIGVNEYLACTSTSTIGQPTNWADADATCRSLGYRLASIETGTEQAALAASGLVAPGVMYWLGATDRAVAGDWIWPTGVVFWRGDRLGAPVAGAYANWDPNYPAAGECAALPGNPERLWVTQDCVQLARALCER